MRRSFKIVIWILVFSGAAGIGAFIASRTELFPPDVEGPGGPGTPSDTTSPTTAPDPVWRGVIRSDSYHDLYVGGRCTTAWSSRLSFRVLDNGKLVGTGTSKLVGDRVCSFPNVQINAQKIEVSVAGSWDATGLSIRLIGGERSPMGTADYGGFAPTVFGGGARSVLFVPLRGVDTARGNVRMERVDEQGRGVFVSANAVSLRCVGCLG